MKKKKKALLSLLGSKLVTGFVSSLAKQNALGYDFLRPALFIYLSSPKTSTSTQASYETIIGTYSIKMLLSGRMDHICLDRLLQINIEFMDL